MAGVELLTSDLIGEIAQPGFLWGVFEGGAPVVVCDSVQDLSFRQEWAISDYPVEGGAFESYDKVSLPFDIRIRFNAGSAASRAALLASLDAIAPTTNVYDVVTPDAVYNSVTVSHVDYHRASNRGLGLLSVEVWFLWVNEQSSLASASGNTATPSGASPVNGGTVQPFAAPSGAAPGAGGGIGAA
jgi:hypothetical protein